jgi:5-methylcytosine-specific restriction endonuclease McrA
MAKTTFSSRGGRVRSSSTPEKPKSERPPEDVVRELKSESRKTEDYRERSLAIHGLICARCAREFDASTRHLLTVHHKDGNHFNNPPDGSNWENLCVYCHEDAHSRELLGDFMSGEGKKESPLVFGGGPAQMGTLAAKLQKALDSKPDSGQKKPKS